MAAAANAAGAAQATRGHRRALTAAAACFAALLMFGFGYAMVPLYYRLCAALGIPTARDFAQPLAEQPEAMVGSGRELRAEFDANAHSPMLAMVPSQRVATMEAGTAYRITYELRNLTDQPLSGRAVPSYSPARAAKWVTKLQCFCFDEINLAAGETLRAPVVLSFAPELPEDIGVVALSYTFFADDAAPAAHGAKH